MNPNETPREARAAYRGQKAHASKRGIPFRMTFEEWAHEWWLSGVWSARGRGASSYAMCRKGDLGAYEVGNVYIATNRQNAQDKAKFRAADEMLAIRCLAETPRTVPPDVVSGWASMHDAITWAFENRDNKPVKTKKWLAENLGMRVQHVTRMLDRRDLKLDPIQAHVCDCLTGWTACDQYRLLEIERIAQRAAAQLVTAMQMRAA